MKVQNLTQGSQEWLEYRTRHFNASDAPAMMGESPYETRDQLIARLASGIAQEATPQQQRIYDDGHRFEALARPLAEEIVGEDLYPIVGSDGQYSASYDGLTLGRDVAFEHKTLNDTLRACMADGCTGDELPKYHQIQMEHQCMVEPAIEQTLFMASKWDSEGQLVEERHCWYTPDLELRERIRQGWLQLERDVLDYKPPVVQIKTIAQRIEALPAIAVQIEGRVLATTLPAFEQVAQEVIAGINTDLQTDQDFADAEETVKFCDESEKRLAAVKEQALGQTASIDELFRTIDKISLMLRDKRLLLTKLVKARKEDIKGEIAREALRSVQDHVAELISVNAGTGWLHQPGITEIVEAMKGKKTVETLRSAANAKAAEMKVAANMRLNRMLQNHQKLAGENQKHAVLFPDFAQVGDKASEDFDALMQLRIARAEQARKEEEERAAAAEQTRLQAEEQHRQRVAEAARMKEQQQAQSGVLQVEVPSPTDQAARVIADVQEAVTASERTIRAFLASRKWPSEREANTARAVLVEYEKFKARTGLFA